ncbi:MAG: ABC transporter ATP-binding protein [bacterium]
MLVLENVSKSYRSAAAGGLQVLRDVSLKLEAGQSVAIIGPSGSGKSTLLNIMGTLDRPTAGKVTLDGKDLLAMGDRELAEVRNSRIGFIFQLHHLLPQLNVLENVLVPALVRSDAGVAGRRALELLEEVGLTGRLCHRPGELSGGEQQRVAVVRALINNPGLVIADEPTGSLDRVGAETLAELLVRVNRKHGAALVVVTHSMPLARRMDVVYELRDGMLVQ